MPTEGNGFPLFAKAFIKNKIKAKCAIVAYTAFGGYSVEAIADADSVRLLAAQTQGLLNAFYGYDYQLHPKKPSRGEGHFMAYLPVGETSQILKCLKMTK